MVEEWIVGVQFGGLNKESILSLEQMPGGLGACDLRLYCVEPVSLFELHAIQQRIIFLHTSIVDSPSIILCRSLPHVTYAVGCGEELG